MAQFSLDAPQTLAHQQVYGGQQGLNQLKQTAREDQIEALRPVAEQFEALFLSQILKESRNVKFDDGWLDGDKADFYKDWHDRQLSQSISSKGSLGLADKIVEQLAPALRNVSKSQVKEAVTSDELGNEQGKSAQSNIINNPQVSPSISTLDNLAFRQLK